MNRSTENPPSPGNSSGLLTALSLTLVLAGATARCNDDMLIYSDRRHNGWDDWGWIQHYATNNPVRSGLNSMCIAPTGPWQAWWLVHDVDTTLYTNVTFWLNGGPTGGQTVGVNAMLNGSGTTRVNVIAPTNSWKQFTVSLASMSAADKTNFNGLQFWSNSGSTQPAFFLDDILLSAKTPPSLVHISINASEAVRTVDARVFGINQVAWDGNVNTPTSVQIMNDLGNPCLRWPGGSWSDGYHWTNEYRGWGSYSSDFIKLASNTHAQAFIIVNYGSSTPEEAAYGVRMFNVTNRCGFKYWEVGNEIGGSWEQDETCWLHNGDITNLNAFASQIYTPTNAISSFVRANLSPGTLAALTNYQKFGNNAAALQYALVTNINPLIEGSSIYDSNRFAGVVLRSVTVSNLGFPASWTGRVLINRMLLEDAYPQSLARLSSNALPDAYLPHDPWTYAMRFRDFYAQMKAADSNILIGAVADISEDGTENNTYHPVKNPRTGATHNGWTPVMLTYMRSNNVFPDFLIEHKYAPTFGDTSDLLWSKTWTADAASLRQMITDYLGSAGMNVTIECTENGGGGDRQRVSLVGGLFYADTIGQILQTEINSRIWWDTRNGPSSISNSDPALYGWRTNSSGSFIYDEGIVYNEGYVTNRYPAYYTAKLMARFASGGDEVVKAGTDFQLLAAYAVKRTNGSLSVLVINKSSYAALPATFSISGHVPLSNATVYSYGMPQDEAARTNGPVQARDLATNSFLSAGPSFNYTFPPYSATVLALSPALPPIITTQPLSQAAVIGGAVNFTVNVSGRSPLTYQWRANELPLIGRTNAELVVANIQASDYADYTVAVTNSDGWAISDRAHLAAAIAPVIVSPASKAGAFTMRFPTELGPTYVVEFKNKLDETVWQTGTEFPGTGLPVSFTNSPITNLSRFYRIHLR